MSTYNTRMKRARNLSAGYLAVFGVWAWARDLPETTVVVVLCGAAVMTMVVYCGDAIYMALSERLDDIKYPNRQETDL